jgi:hypothetical protein
MCFLELLSLSVGFVPRTHGPTFHGFGRALQVAACVYACVVDLFHIKNGALDRRLLKVPARRH